MATTPKRQNTDEAKLVSREIGLQIRARRNEFGLTQTELARKIGVSQQQINKYERGVGRIPADQLRKLCQILKMPLASVFGPLDNLSTAGFAESPQTPFVVEAFADKDTVKLVRSFQSIENKNVRKKVLRLIEAIADEAGDADPEKPRPKRS